MCDRGILVNEKDGHGKDRRRRRVQHQGDAISLSVEDGNRARRLYERAGFEAVGCNGGSDTVRLDLDA